LRAIERTCERGRRVAWCAYPPAVDALSFAVTMKWGAKRTATKNGARHQGVSSNIARRSAVSGGRYRDLARLRKADAMRHAQRLPLSPLPPHSRLYLKSCLSIARKARENSRKTASKDLSATQPPSSVCFWQTSLEQPTCLVTQTSTTKNSAQQPHGSREPVIA
jgi:hypothetical protein